MASGPDTRPSVSAPVARVALASSLCAALMSCGGGDGAAPTAAPPSAPASPPAPTVASLEVDGTGVLTSIGETTRFTVTATLPDGSKQAVEASEAAWESSDPAVATVSQGVLTAVGGGNATLTATHGGQSAEVPVSVRISTRQEGTVRVLYVSPADRQFRADYSEVITHAIVDVQSWYRRQMGGLTFQLYQATPEWCQMSEDADHYGRAEDIWGEVVEDVQHCAPVVLPGERSSFTWVLYVDAEEACDDYRAALGAGGWGLTLLGGIDLNRMANGGGTWVYCDIGEYDRPFLGYLGGLAHEFAHTLGVPHPPGCEAGLAICDRPALMDFGFDTYPDTYLRFDDKEQVLRSRFITGARMPGAGFDAVGDTLEVRGAVLGPTGTPLEGSRISAWSDPFWTWGETGRDGTFTIGLPHEASSPVALSVHAPEAAECTWLGYHTSGGLTSWLDEAAPVALAEGAGLPVEVRLPGAVDELCAAQKTVSGTVRGPDGQPLAGIWLRLVERFSVTGHDGRFEIAVPWWLGEFREALGLGSELCEFGFYGRDGLTNMYADGLLEIGAGDPNLEIGIRLPASPAELCRQQSSR